MGQAIAGWYVGLFLLDAAVRIRHFRVMKRIVAKPRKIWRPDTVLNPNEIAHRIDGLRERAADGAKVALKAMLEISKLLRVMVDVHGYRGDRYVRFAARRGINRSDAYLLYHVAQDADRVLRRCDIEARRSNRYEWPHWREIARRGRSDEGRPTTLAAERAKREVAEQQLAMERRTVAALRQQLSEQPSRYKHGPGGGYIVTPPDLIPTRLAEFKFDFDPCPHPLPKGFNGLARSWGHCNFVNPPFRADDNTEGQPLSSWVKKAIEEQKKGRTSVLVLPTTDVVNLLAEAGAEMRALGRVPWLHRETGEPWKSPGAVTAFILRPQ